MDICYFLFTSKPTHFNVNSSWPNTNFKASWIWNIKKREVGLEISFSGISSQLAPWKESEKQLMLPYDPMTHLALNN